MTRTNVLEALEDAMDACRTMAGWTDSAVRAYDYQEAESALRALKEALEEFADDYERYPDCADPDCKDCHLASLLAGPTGEGAP